MLRKAKEKVSKRGKGTEEEEKRKDGKKKKRRKKEEERGKEILERNRDKIVD